MKTAILKKALESIITSIDNGMCELDDADTDALLSAISNYMDKGVFLSKYEACREIGIERSRFDDLVREGKIPRGTAKPGAKELFWRKKDVLEYKASRQQMK